MKPRELIPSNDEWDAFALTKRQYTEGDFSFKPSCVREYITAEDCRFRAYIDKRYDSDIAVVVPAEFGNALPIKSGDGLEFQLTRAEMMRASVERSIGRAATLVFLPNNGYGQDNLSFSKNERRTLANGSLQPYSARLDALLKQERLADEHVMIVGFSQGASIAIDYMHRQDEYQTDASRRSIVAIDTPDHPTPLDFMVSGFDIVRNRKSNNIRGVGLSMQEGAYWAFGALSSSNILTARALSRQDTGTLMHVTNQATLLYGTCSPVSSEAKHIELLKDGYDVYRMDTDHSLSSRLCEMHTLIGRHAIKYIQK